MYLWPYFFLQRIYKSQNKSLKLTKWQPTKSETQRASIQQKPLQEEGCKSSCGDKLKNHITH